MFSDEEDGAESLFGGHGNGDFFGVLNQERRGRNKWPQIFLKLKTKEATNDMTYTYLV